MRDMITRYAPAPTGYLHLGHVLNAIYVWGVAGLLVDRCRVLLRIEDHDAQRSRPHYEAAIIEDLGWLGFKSDGPAVRQSDRREIYERALAALRARGLVYAGGCSRREVQGFRRQGVQGELRYTGGAGERGLSDGPRMTLRVRLDRRSSGSSIWCGPQQQSPCEQCGDLAIRDRDATDLPVRSGGR
jgi:glutamyl/glutaminyl-tRNA synthetase